MTLYTCFETAYYYNKASGARIAGFEAWDHCTSSSVNFSSWPKTQYKFDDKVEVRQRHHENVKILYRPRENSQVNLHTEEGDEQEWKTQYGYPTDEEASSIVDLVDA